MKHIEDTHRSTAAPIPAPTSHKCNFCEYLAVSDDSLQVHIKANHNQTTMKSCTLCEFDATNTIQMKEHIETAHSSDIQLHVLQALSELTTVVKTLTDPHNKI